jgi:hypothetical protein
MHHAQWLSFIPEVFIKIYVHPPAFHEVRVSAVRRPANLICLQVPLKRFYRFEVSPRLTFDENGYVQDYHADLSLIS